MTEGERREPRSFVRGAAVGFLAIALVACGDMPETGVEVTPPVPMSPTAGEIPEETFMATATIADGALEPDQFAGQIGTAFELVITGDGSQHTLMIDQMVDDTTIAAEGDTSIAFTIVGEPGISDILLDGQPAGTFERQSAGGITDP